MAAAGRRVGALVHRLTECKLETRIAGVVASLEANRGSLSSHVCCKPSADLRALATCAPISNCTEFSQRLPRFDRQLKKNFSIGRGAGVRLESTSSGTTTHSASAKAAAEAAAIRGEVNKVKEEAQFHEEVNKINDEAPDESKIHQGAEKLKEDSSKGNPEERNKNQTRDTEAERDEHEEVLDEKTKALRAALEHVPKLGWTEAAMSAGARDVGLSPAIVGAFPRKEAALVEFFMDECALALAEELEDREEELAKMVLKDRVAEIVWTRLQMQIPYLSKWAQALSIQANPLNAPSSLKQRALLVDDIWHAAGDRSTDMDWYAKRALLAGVYSTTELYMLTDTSPGFKDTKTFLERRIADAIDCRKSVQEASQLAQALGAGFQNTLNSFLNRARSPSGFKF
ncbi:hypothetical protein R1flu_001313 [Riccia fluitans]|uniref:Ubiquinone biosynthesis protein n=1 Tax=Riccia fluitans TaxID=41844 RepID=A0ABD1Y352_9MARC